jgi:hypothetical protein
MQAEEHVQAARNFLVQSDLHFAGVDRLQGSETLWGAAAHAILAVSRARRWRLGSHGRLRENADRLSTELSEQDIADDFQVAEKFHTNFYHNYLEDFRISRDRPLVHRFVSRVLALPELGGGTI